MEQHAHSMNNLFSQLGQPSDDLAIDRFIAANRPMAGATRLHEAAFWNASQSEFLQRAIGDDADWAAVADALNSELHVPG